MVSKSGEGKMEWFRSVENFRSSVQQADRGLGPTEGGGNKVSLKTGKGEREGRWARRLPWGRSDGREEEEQGR